MCADRPCVCVVCAPRFGVGVVSLVVVTVGYPLGTLAYLFTRRDAFGKSSARYTALGTWIDDDMFEQFWWYVTL
jgi:hypothetical protein